MQTRIVHTKIWSDGFFVDLNPTEKLLFLYFLTNPKVNIIHCYELSLRETTFDTSLDRTTIEKSKVKFTEGGKILFRADYVYLINAQKYESYDGPKNEKAKARLINQLPNDIKEWYLRRGTDTPIHTPTDKGIKPGHFPLGDDTPIDTSINTPSIGTINHKSEIINTDTPIHTPTEGLDSLRPVLRRKGLNV